MGSLLRKILVIFMVLTLTFIGADEVYAAPVKRYIDILALNFPNVSQFPDKIIEANANLQTKSMPYWNSILGKSNSEFELVFGIQEVEPMLSNHISNCDGNTALRFIETIK